MPIRKSSVSGSSTPSGTSADRPSSPSIGDTFFNGTLGVQEIYTTSGWLPATGANDFNIVLTGSETAVTLDKEYFSGAYTISSALLDSTFDIYLFDTQSNSVGYTNTPSVNATGNFNKIIVYGGTSGDLLSFAYKTTFTTSATTTDTFAAPYVTSVSAADLANIDDTTTINGGNFDTDIQVWFDGQNSYSQQAKSVVYGSSTSIVATRPDDLVEDNAPYTIRIVNPGTTSPSGSNKNKLINAVTAGGDPVWTTSSGALDVAPLDIAYSVTVEATDPDGGAIAYSLTTGSLPTGLFLNSSTGEISGTATTIESQTFIITATDTGGNTTNRSFIINTSIAAGGAIADISGYRTHTFTSSGTFTVFSSLTADYLIVGGGGGGGGGATNNNDGGGGGGAGGLIFTQSLSVSPNSYTIEIGAGGAGGTVQLNGVNGISSSAFGQTALPGGFGGLPNTTGGSGNGVVGSGGGSGGGGATSGNSAASGTPGQGNSGGGKEAAYPYQGAGGGGHSSPGVGAFGSASTNGGNGTDYSAYFGTSVGEGGYFAGGGGGGGGVVGSSTGSNFQGAGGIGGGGNGGAGLLNGQGSDTGDATSGLQYSGGGGGGGSNVSQGSATTKSGGNGGSGVVIIRYPL